MRGRILGALLLVVGFAAIGRADEKPLDRAEMDRRVVYAAFDAAKLGTEIFNKGKHEECFRLYQGTLIGLQPFLDHRANLARFVKDKLDKAKGMNAVDGSFALREALDEIQNDIAPSKVDSKSDAKVDPKVPKDPKKTTLWDRLGGEKTVRLVVRDLIILAAEDKDVNYFRDGKVKLDAKSIQRMEQLYVELISLMSSGPLPYTEKRTLKDAHAGMKITDKEFDAFVALMKKVLEKHKVGKAEIDELLTEVNKTREVIVEAKDKGKNGL
jgi:hemoglobin